MASKKKWTILIVDDDRLFCDIVSQQIASDQIHILKAHSLLEAKGIYPTTKVDVVLLDQQLPDGAGKDLCPAILSHNDQAKIIFITGFPSFENAVEAIKIGAHDYLSKPLELDELSLTIKRALRTLDLERVEQVQTYIDSREREETVLVGSQNGLAETRRLVELAANNEAAVLITGETGTGKSVVARTIHYLNPAKPGTFISVNCAALPENLIESELFGYEKGAFSGAVSSKKGLFEMAEGGSLSLEEIGELPIHLQSKLLGVLDDKYVRRLGGESPRPIQVRIMATTNMDLEPAIEDGRFRRDLFYRLSVLRIHLPPLRKRPEDIPELCRHFIHKIAPNVELTLLESELKKLSEYHWPGNVRELRNILERSIILRQGPEIKPSELLGPPGATSPEASIKSHSDEADSEYTAPGQNNTQIDTMEDMEKKHIRRALDVLDHNYTRTASALGISRSTLMRKIKQYQLS